MLTLSADAAISVLHSPWAAEELAPGALVVEFAASPPDWPVSLPPLPCVTVAVPRRPDLRPDVLASFDVVVADESHHRSGWVARAGDLDEAVTALAEAVDAHPQAALVAAQVLRATERQPPAVGLMVESLAYSMLQAGPEFKAWLKARPSRPPRPSTEPAVLVERDGDRLVITLNRPEVRNALDGAMRDGLVNALRTAAADTGIGEVVLRGNGPSFCSGGDLAEFGTAPDPVTAHRVRLTRSPAAWAAAIAPRLRAEVHGACVGAGIELAAWAGQLVADADASFLLPEVAMGLIPGAGGTASIPRRIGRQRTAYLALSGRSLDAAAALAWGLVDRVR